jgi:hypothetical protein
MFRSFLTWKVHLSGLWLAVARPGGRHAVREHAIIVNDDARRFLMLGDQMCVIPQDDAAGNYRPSKPHCRAEVGSTARK